MDSIRASSGFNGVSLQISVCSDATRLAADIHFDGKPWGDFTPQTHRAPISRQGYATNHRR